MLSETINPIGQSMSHALWKDKSHSPVYIKGCDWLFRVWDEGHSLIVVLEKEQYENGMVMFWNVLNGR